MRKYPSNFICKQCGKPVPRLGRFCRKCWMDPVRRFWSYVKKTPTCWLWIGDKRLGYGRLRVNGEKVSAHRFSCELHKGPLPKGKKALHNCPNGDNPSCVNPDHLWAGTQAENVKDMYVKGRR